MESILCRLSVKAIVKESCGSPDIPPKPSACPAPSIAFKDADPHVRSRPSGPARI